MSFIRIIIFIFLLCFLMIGAEIYESDIEKGVERDIYNYTEESIKIPLSNISGNYPIEKTRGIINQGRLYKILESGINFMFVSVEQISKMGVEYGYQNPNINWQQIWKYAMYLLIIFIVVTLIKPIGYLIIFIVMLIMMLKDKSKKRKHKEEET